MPQRGTKIFVIFCGPSELEKVFNQEEPAVDRGADCRRGHDVPCGQTILAGATTRSHPTRSALAVVASHLRIL